MRRTYNSRELLQPTTSRYRYTDWSSNSQSVTTRSEQQRTLLYQISQELQSTREDSAIQIHWASENTKYNLSCRIEELKIWKNKITDGIFRVEQETSLLKQVKEFAETCMQEKSLYRQILWECVTLRSGCLANEFDPVKENLTKEEQLCESIKPLFQQRILQAMQHLRVLKQVHNELLADQRDKDEAIVLTDQCLSLAAQSAVVEQGYQPTYIAKRVLTYEQWIEHCRHLKENAEKAIRESSFFRSNLHYTISEFLNAVETQCRATDFSFRKQLDEMIRAKEALEWEKQQVIDAISELQEEIQKVENQILYSDTEEQLVQARLGILEQRVKYELCLDQDGKNDRHQTLLQPYNSLLQDYQKMSKNTNNLRQNVINSKKTLEATRNNLFYLEEGIREMTTLIKRDQKCQDIHQRLLSLCSMPTFSAELTDTKASSVRSLSLCSTELDETK